MIRDKGMYVLLLIYRFLFEKGNRICLRRGIRVLFCETVETIESSANASMGNRSSRVLVSSALVESIAELVLLH